MISLGVIVRHISPHSGSERTLAEEDHTVQALFLEIGLNRSANAFRFGDCGGSGTASIFGLRQNIGERLRAAMGHAIGRLTRIRQRFRDKRTELLPPALDLQSLPADLEAHTTAMAAAAVVTGGDQLDPQRIRGLVVRGDAGLAQRIQAVLRAPEAALVNPGISTITHEPASSSIKWRSMDVRSVVALNSVPARTLVPTGMLISLPLRLRITGGRAAGAAAAAAADRAKAKATTIDEAHAPDIALAHRGVPGGLDLAGFRVDGDAVIDAVVDDNEGIGAKAERAVPVLEHGGLVGRAACIIVVAPLAAPSAGNTPAWR